MLILKKAQDLSAIVLHVTRAGKAKIVLPPTAASVCRAKSGLPPLHCAIDMQKGHHLWQTDRQTYLALFLGAAPAQTSQFLPIFLSTGDVCCESCVGHLFPGVRGKNAASWADWVEFCIQLGAQVFLAHWTPYTWVWVTKSLKVCSK